MSASRSGRPSLGVTSLSQYVRLENCDRYLRFELEQQDVYALQDKWKVAPQPLTPLLKDAGAEFEENVVERIAKQEDRVVDLEESDLEATLELLRGADESLVLLQPKLQAPLGDYLLRGRADVVQLTPKPRGGLKALVVDIKASRRERTEHRLQVAVYARLLQHMAQSIDEQLSRVEGAVFHLQDDGSIPTLGEDVFPFDLETYTHIIDRLVGDEDSVLNRVASVPLEDIFYHLSYKCDVCLYNRLCMHNAAEDLDLSLTPYISAVEKRVLQEAGVDTLPKLAKLMNLPEPGAGDRTLQPAPAYSAVVEGLNNEWPVGPNLPVLVQRARRALSQFDSTVDSRYFIYDSGFGSLPSEKNHPNLVKVFFDAQQDYLKDRVYLISGLVTGPNGEHSVVRCTPSPPSLDDERTLLLDWVRGILRAIRTVAVEKRASVHLYCYNRYDQKVLLEALKRHMEDVAALPAFFDLMTQSPAVEQPIISFLSSEIEQRVNLGRICTPLHAAARMLGFDWQDSKYQFYRVFWTRLFDNRRDMIRLPDGTMRPIDRETAQDDPRRFPIEAASRFNSQIPLEYAYGAWGQLPEDTGRDHLLEPFREISWAQLKAFAAHRARALAHIEDRFKNKALGVPKPKLDLPSLDRPPTASPELARSLEEFLYMEHYASLQEKLLNYSLPIERRVQTGLALLLRYETYNADQELHHFAIDFEEVGLDPALTMNALKLKEGSWVVINEADKKLSAGRIKHGRIAIIRNVGDDWLDLEMLPITFRNQEFRYWHRNSLQPQPGRLYTLDDMADDMNADKALAALHHSKTNVLYHWLLDQPTDRAVDHGLQSFSEKFARLIDHLEGKNNLTKRQREVVAERLTDPLLLVQGPPGTGKSLTLAWAILARIAAHAANGRPCRVAVSCKTHNAVNVVLEMVAAKLRLLTGFPSPATKSLQNLTIYKIVNDMEDDVPSGVRRLKLYGHDPDKLDELVRQPLVVIGGTPGGLYNLARYRATGGRKRVDWGHKSFDFVLIDEASQMSVPEALLAGAWLKPEGSMIVVGDHRQMPPIIAHTWETEEKRTATYSRPYLSLFESLIERKFPCVALDESFRLHKVIAEFLKDNVYARDGIDFFSRREQLLPSPPSTHGFVDAALDPDYPIVVIEHTENQSQQYNEVELKLMSPIIDVCAHRLRLDGTDGVGIVVPHRAQKAMLRKRFPNLAVTESIDTVERFQGSERDVIIVSATASDPDYVLAEADFLLDLKRLNVALSRPRQKLIVVASESVIDLLTSDLDVFENAVIWKNLYYRCTSDTLWQGTLEDVSIRIRGKAASDGA